MGVQHIPLLSSWRRRKNLTAWWGYHHIICWHIDNIDVAFCLVTFHPVVAKSLLAVCVLSWIGHSAIGGQLSWYTVTEGSFWPWERVGIQDSKKPDCSYQRMQLALAPLPTRPRSCASLHWLDEDLNPVILSYRMALSNCVGTVWRIDESKQFTGSETNIHFACVVAIMKHAYQLFHVIGIGRLITSNQEWYW